MALSVFCKKVIKAGLANRVAADELIAAVDTLANLANMNQGAAVAALGALLTVGPPAGAIAPMGVGAVDVACALAADVDAAFGTVQGVLDASIARVDLRAIDLQAKIDALTASLRTANIIAT